MLRVASVRGRLAATCGAKRCVIDCPQKRGTTRDPRFSKVEASDVAVWREMIGAANVLDDPARVEPFNYDWFKDYKGDGTVVLTPTTTEEVAAVVKHCAQRRLAVVPQGGNTGFVGGAVPVFDEVVISMKKMNKVIEVDDLAGTIKCQAGCVLETLDLRLREHGLMMPVDLGAKGSCFIGGNVSTAAGGVRFMRYGSMHGNTLGLKAVLPNGEILNVMNTLKKDNTGYDLKQLFIGAEGTLGVVTEVAIQLATFPKSVQTVFLGAPDWESLCNIFRRARAELGEILSAAEMIDGDALDLILEITKDKSPLDQRCPYYFLLETNGSNADSDKEKLMNFLANAEESGIVKCGTIAESGAQAKQIWALRENCALAPTAAGHVRWYDISMPSGRMKEMIDLARAEIEKAGWSDRAKIIGFGHFGDGNLHVNVVTIPHYDAKVCDLVDNFMYGFSKKNGYSVSAEHGIGLQKRGYLTYTKSPETVAWMKQVKALFDPNGIMNPYKMFMPM
jgi:FAD/FMN-containing dehydrogenase